jgi:hypothetical protein
MNGVVMLTILYFSEVVVASEMNVNENSLVW